MLHSKGVSARIHSISVPICSIFDNLGQIFMLIYAKSDMEFRKSASQFAHIVTRRVSEQIGYAPVNLSNSK